MTSKAVEIREQYTERLRTYLTGGDERELAHASDLGRMLFSKGSTVLDVVALHHTVLSEVAPTLGQSVPVDVVGRGGEFLTEALAPFEIAHRGFREATESSAQIIRLAAILGHEIRTPLTSVIASGGMLQDELASRGDAVLGRLAASVLAGARAIKARTDELVDAASLESGTLTLRTERVNTSAFLKGICVNLEPMVRDSHLDMLLDIPSDLPVMYLDPGRFQQVISNLVLNAVKFGKGGGRIEVRARATDHLRVEVKDYGPGITEEDQVVLFKPFFRGSAGQRSGTGLGIGLMLCHELIAAHGGRLFVDSEQGQGATFVITLPFEERGKRLQ